MQILTVVIGLIFVLLLLSLLATTIMELLASGLGLRGKNLEKALKNILATTDEDDKLLQDFKDNSLYKQLSYHYGKQRYSPSYLSDKSFQSILFDVILKGEGFDHLNEKIGEIENEDLKNVLGQLLKEANEDLEGFKEKVREWYNDIMDRASGWYKRNTQKILVVVGIAIAVIFNADTITIYQRLEKDPETLSQIVVAAESYVNSDSQVISQADIEMKQSLEQLKSAVREEIEAIESPLGLGWSNANFKDLDGAGWAIKILGWIVTALAISLGAPFWFDLLQSLVNVRGSGNKPSNE